MEHILITEKITLAQLESFLFWHLYVIRTADNYLYSGISTDVARRLKEHMALGPRSARFFLAHRPVALAFSQAIGSRGLTLKVEYHFKQLSKEQKERIVTMGQLDFERESGKIRIP